MDIVNITIAIYVKTTCAEMRIIMNHMDIKMIVTDLDGTLLKDDKSISTYTENIIKQLRNRGILFVVATARPIRAVKTFLPQINYDAAIFHNGAVVMDHETLLKSLGVRNPRKIVNAILDDNPDYKIAVESNDVMYSNFNAEEIWPGIDYIKTSDFKELEDSYAEKVIVDAHSTEEMNKLMKYMADDLYMLPSENRIITIHNIQSTKMNGIKTLAEHYNISPSQIVSFGDDYNDIDMLGSCGIGVAVENALPEVKKAAKEITESNEQDGVAKWLERFLGI